MVSLKTTAVMRRVRVRGRGRDTTTPVMSRVRVIELL